MAGTQIGSYRIERTLGTGGFGVVYVGVDVRLGRRAAIKQLLPELSGQREIVERFFNEAKAAASINHPGIVEIYDVGWHTDGSAYFAMKLLDGDSLSKRLRATGPMAVQLATTIARQISSALIAAHARGIVHRDLKPDNIVLVPDDEVAIGERATVLDFGIAKLFGDRPGAQKTRTGMMMGTPTYMSPEQCRGAGEVDHRTDVYALGCILFEMLTGQPPFVGEGAGELLGKHQFVPAPMLRSLRPDVPPELEVVVMRTLAKNPAERFQQMSELTAALQPFSTGGRAISQPFVHTPPPARPLSDPGATSPAGLPLKFVATPAAQLSTFSESPGEQYRQPRALAAGSNRRGLVIGAGAVVVIGAVSVIAAALSSSSSERQAASPADAEIVANPDAEVIAKLKVDAAVIAPAVPDAAAPAGVDAGVPSGQASGVAGDIPAKTPSPAPAPVPPPQPPQMVPPTLFEEHRIKGNNNVVPDKATKTALAKSGKDKAVGSFRLCLDPQGTITSITQLKSTGFADYDTKIQSEMRQWAYKPFLVNGKAAPVCATITFTYSQGAQSLPALCNFDEMLKKGDDLTTSGAYAAALASYEELLRCKLDERSAYIALAKAYTSACNSGNTLKAKTYFKRLPPAMKGPFSQVCVRNGIDPE